MTVPRSEYPRPDFRRELWLCLNGQWDFSIGESTFDKKITVPYACEAPLSGIGDKGFHKTVWYRRTFTLPEEMVGKRILLHFGAVDYICDVWINGQHVCSHTGGQVGFEADITEALLDGENTIQVKAFDDYADPSMPRGKQYWELESKGMYYSRTTGIWQTVWVEAVDPLHLVRCHITPQFDDRAVQFEYLLSQDAESIVFEISFRGEKVAEQTVPYDRRKPVAVVSLAQVWNDAMAWSPENPSLFDVRITVRGEKGITDVVDTYFGMRKVGVENGKFMLNNREYYQKLVLDQGYWEESLMTAPTDEAFIRDIQMTKAMGFNGVRKHQKVEDPRYLYHADRLGLLVWGEIGSAYIYSKEYISRIHSEWIEAVARDYNHPCIVVWTPMNESWGVGNVKTDKAQQAHCNAMMLTTKALDPTRVVIDNDGWEHTCGDLVTLHDYTQDGNQLKKQFASLQDILAIQMKPHDKPLFADGYGYQGQPILLSEFGGVKNGPDLQQKLSEIFQAVQASPVLCGYCYTQLTDIENECNGLLSYRREPKLPLETICAINQGTWEE
jgi:beta-galactosidase/beta-glucuronidase